MGEYLKVYGNEHLLGKRARFKNNLPGYSAKLWGKEGVIIQDFQIKPGDLDHVGLSLDFGIPKDKILPPGELHTCYIMPGSIELI